MLTVSWIKSEAPPPNGKIPEQVELKKPAQAIRMNPHMLPRCRFKAEYNPEAQPISKKPLIKKHIEINVPYGSPNGTQFTYGLSIQVVTCLEKGNSSVIDGTNQHRSKAAKGRKP